MDTYEIKHCINCKKQIRGRKDKKFCNDSCRSYFNNQVKAVEDPHVKRINTILKRNRNVLRELLNDSPLRVINKNKLLTKAFHFGYTTHVEDQDTYYLYEYRYRSLPGNMIQIEYIDIE